MPRSVYVETSVVSYLTSRRNQRDLIVAAHQELTREWWETRRHEFNLYASAVVVEEAREGFAARAMKVSHAHGWLSLTNCVW